MLLKLRMQGDLVLLHLLILGGNLSIWVVSFHLSQVLLKNGNQRLVPSLASLQMQQGLAVLPLQWQGAVLPCDELSLVGLKQHWIQHQHQFQQYSMHLRISDHKMKITVVSKLDFHQMRNYIILVNSQLGILHF